MTAATLPRHRKPRTGLLARLRAILRRRYDGTAEALNWLYRLGRDTDITPAAAAQIQAHVCGALLERIQPVHPPAWAPVEAATGPLPPSMQDNDPRYPHLARAWADSTGTFRKIIEGESSDPGRV